MVRRLGSMFLVSVLAFSASATTRYVTDRAAAPVKWQEWGQAAIERARKENRPLFVSIGFAASWDCQRMHREAFLNGENAEALNAYFIPVLLDRIEYREAAEAYEAMQPGDGWPVNLILTPNLEPIAGARFLSTADLSRMLVIQANRWASERAAVISEAKANLAKVQSVPPANEVFPPTSVDALRALAAGPRRDALGGGFHRCDDCFEKLLTDQALLAMAYLEAWQKTHDPDLAFVARTTLDAVLRDLVPPQGMFQSAQDAHSLVPGQGPVFVEGAFYLWTKDEVTRLLGQETAGKIFSLYSMHEGGNRLVLGDPRRLHETYDELAAPLQRMLQIRQTRPAPFREVAIAGSNGLMISALARAAVAFHERTYLDAATSTAKLVSTKLWNASTKTLVRTESRTDALAEDYAMLVQGTLDLFESTSDVKWLELAIALQQKQDQRFRDAGRDTPVGAIAMKNVSRLAALTGNEVWRTRSTLAAPKIVVVVGRAGREETETLLRATQDRWEPNRILLFVPDRGTQRQRIVGALPFIGALTPDPERGVVYECAAGQCRKQ
jgi:uncharacterized protein YyaL (SSP411 family)